MSKVELSDVLKGSGGLDQIIKSEEDLKFIGSQNLQSLIRYWRRESKMNRAKLEKLEKCFYFLKSIQPDPRKFQKLYSRSGLIEKLLPSLLEVIHGNEPKMRSIPENFTTLHYCGWCKNATASQLAGACNLNPKCKFFEAVGIDEVNDFYTPCRIMDKNTIDHLLELANQKNAKTLEEHYFITSVLAEFLPAIIKLEDAVPVPKPYLPQLQPDDHFKIGDLVMCYFGGDPRTLGKKWLKGNVIPDPLSRGHGICVHFDRDLVALSEYQVGFFPLPYAPMVMHLLDFEYLQKNHDYAELVVKAWQILMELFLLSLPDYTFPAEKFLESLSEQN